MAATRRQHKNQKESAWVPPLQRDPGPWNRLLLNWLATLAIIMVFGLVMLYSASYTTGYLRMGDSLHYIKQQAICMAIGIGCMVHFALFDAMQKQGQIWENEAQVDTDSAAGTELLEACRDADGSLDELARLLLSLDLQEALRQLNPAQRQVMMLLFAQELKPSEAAKRLGCSVRNVTKHRLKALDKLRARAAIKIQKDCRLAVLFLRRFI